MLYKKALVCDNVFSALQGQCGIERIHIIRHAAKYELHIIHSSG